MLPCNIAGRGASVIIYSYDLEGAHAHRCVSSAASQTIIELTSVRQTCTYLYITAGERLAMADHDAPCINRIPSLLVTYGIACDICISRYGSFYMYT